MQNLKLILGLVAGCIVTGLSIFFLEDLGRGQFKQYQNVPSDPKLLDAFIMSLPSCAFIALLLAHIVSVFVGTITAGLISGCSRYIPAIVIGVFMSSFSVINAIEISQPLWYTITDTALMIPVALIAQRTYLKLFYEK